MRLINIHTLESEDFFNPPQYAILSHRWVGREITYEQFNDSSHRQTRPGYEKIARFCNLLRETRDDLPSHVDWAWIDTCCIDKRSSAELSEAINTMWQWYWKAEYCIAYLFDVEDSNMASSQYFTRGWTLQEMLAPHEVYFYNTAWKPIGTRSNLSKDLFLSTSVPEKYLQPGGREKIPLASVAQRMNWASHRTTTRLEDEAYCLFGLFGVNLPLLYGEGSTAFIRLQEEIIRTSRDESIFAWRPQADKRFKPYVGLIASSPAEFRLSSNIMPMYSFDRRPFRVTNKGIEISAVLRQPWDNEYVLALDCVELSPETGKAARCLLVLVKFMNGTFMRKEIHPQQRAMEPYKDAGRLFEEADSEEGEEEVIYVQKTARQTDILGNHLPGGVFSSHAIL